MIAFQSVFPSFRGGISTFSNHLYHHLADRYPVRPFNFSQLYPRFLFPGKSQFLEHNSKEYATPLLHAWNPINWKSTARRMVHRDTMVYMYSHWHPFFAPAQIAVINEIRKTNPDTKIAGIIHNVLPHERFPGQETLTKILFRKTDHPVILSEQTHQQFRTLMDGKNPERLFHPVYDQAWPSESRETVRKRLGYEPNDKVVLFFGLVRPYKGLDIFIDALNMMNLDTTSIKPLIVGEFYIDPVQFTNRIRKDHLPYYEIINRYVSEEEAARYLLASDVMVLPYRTASQSGVLSNAFNFNLPVVVTDLPGLTEHVEHGSTGFIVPPGDPVSLAKELLHISTETDLEKLRKQVALARENLTWQRFTDELCEILGLTEYRSTVSFLN